MKIIPLIALISTPIAYAGQDCPKQFHQVPLHEQASFCHAFNDDVPASLSYHAPGEPAQNVDFYKASLGEPEALRVEKGRTVMQYAANIVVVSTDGNGSQVDILIK